jgi:hypothetical protein
MIANNGQNILFLTSIMQKSILLPNEIDIYSTPDDDKVVNYHRDYVKRLNTYLKNTFISLHHLLPHSQFYSEMRIRKTILDYRIDQMTTFDDDQHSSSHWSPITNNLLVQSISVSSNMAHIDRLSDGRVDTFWESNDTATSHYIRLQLRSRTIINRIRIGVDVDDASYMPEHIKVFGGQHRTQMSVELADVHVSRHARFVDISLNYGSQCYYRLIQVCIYCRSSVKNYF